MLYNVDIENLLNGVKMMELLKKRIVSDGVIMGTDIVKVDGFLNHRVDPFLLKEIALEIVRRYEGEKITKVLTIEASGIAIAALVALELGVPFVFAKKYNAKNLDASVYQTDVFSFTKQKTFSVRVSSKYIGKDDNVLIVDDFLAKGGALQGLINITEMAGAKVCGCAIVIEKSFQEGADLIRSKGYRIESLARIKSINDGIIEFLDCV